MDIEEKKPAEPNLDPLDSRRRFLEAAGRFALATPPAITLLLASGSVGPAWASGGNSQGGNSQGGNSQGGNSQR